LVMVRPLLKHLSQIMGSEQEGNTRAREEMVKFWPLRTTVDSLKLCATVNGARPEVAARLMGQISLTYEG
jgi:hypothetical protein